MRRLGALILIAGIAFGAGSPGAYGAVFEPTRFDDPPPNGCPPNNCSLREAIDAANEEPNRDTIVLAQGTYEIEIPHLAGAEYNETGDLAPYYPTTIRGEGPRATKVDANGLDRVFSVASVLDERPVKFQGLTMKGGNPGPITDPQHPGVGGGIYAYTEHVVLNDVAIRRNEAEAGGGARLQATTLKIVNSTISGNAAGAGGGIQFPSAIFETPVATIRGTTISGNTATRGGGVIAAGPPTMSLYPPQVSFTNSTIAGNHTTADGGGILAEEQAVVFLDNSTVAHNIAEEDNTGGSLGGGIRQLSSAAFGLDDSLIAGNTVGTTGNGSQCAGAFQGSGGVVVQLQAGTSCSISGTTPIEPVDPLIGPLEANGGPTKTVKLLAGSAALGIADSCPAKDQRGKPRPIVDCDAGAYEREGP